MNLMMMRLCGRTTHLRRNVERGWIITHTRHRDNVIRPDDPEKMDDDELKIKNLECYATKKISECD